MRNKFCHFFTLFLVCFALVSNQCQKQQISNFKTFRLIDHLKKENIIRSPLINSPHPGNDSFPLKSFLMNDLGIGENPFLLKRKLRIGSSVFNILFSPPESHFRFQAQIPEQSYFEFSIGIVRDQNSSIKINPSNSTGKGVVFLVTIEEGRKEKIIFQKYLAAPPATDDLSFTQSTNRIHLPSVQKNVTLSLKTKGETPYFAYWGNPVIYQASSKENNIILISIDTLRADHLGCYGYPKNTSPHIDTLASDGTLFMNSFSSSPWTLPSHVSIMTSLFGVHHQISNGTEKITSSLLTLADVLRINHFFNTAFTGGGFVSAHYGFSKGFDAYHEGTGSITHINSAELMYKAFSNWLNKNERKRFFLFLHTYQTHDPYSGHPPYTNQFLHENSKWTNLDFMGYLGGWEGIFKKLPENERDNAVGLYDGEIRYVDDNLIGPLVAKLKETDLYDNTMIILTSDHGEEFFDHKGWTHGHSLYNELIRVPLIIKFPHDKFSGKTVSCTVSSVDIMPTVLDEMDIDFSDMIMDGQSLFPVLKGRETDERLFLADIGDNLMNAHIPQKVSMIQGKYKLILNKEFSRQDLDFFTVPPPDTPRIELYNLTNDMREKNNIADKNPSLIQVIVQKINAIYSQAKKRKPEKTEIDEKLKEQLKALGYIH
jgi:arylsulfatase A-like enzyme